MLTLSIFSVRVCLVHKQCRKHGCRRRRSQNFTSEGRGFAEVASRNFPKDSRARESGDGGSPLGRGKSPGGGLRDKLL